MRRKTTRSAPAAPKPEKRTFSEGLRIAADAMQQQPPREKDYAYPIQAPKLMPGVVPAGKTAPVMAMDYSSASAYSAQAYGLAGGFPGYPYLSQLATRAEYRNFAAALATEVTREGWKFTSKQTDGDESNDKIKRVEEEFKRLGIRDVIHTAVAHDCFFGRAQIYVGIAGADKALPLVIHPKTVPIGSLERVTTVEPIWTTPSAYNSLDPAAKDFFRPTAWFMLGQQVHASRLLTVITRPVPDILKPAFNFSGMSLSQLAEPYVDNWLRTRQSVSDLIANFSITGLATSMDQLLQGDDSAALSLVNRAKLFTATRTNQGLMLLDKDREEIVQVNTPLSGLDHLQAQAQEHMCSVSRIPAMILTGISPSGLNASSEGELRAFEDWIAAQQEAYWRKPLEVILDIVQLSLFGKIDPDIGLEFNPLRQMTPAELAEIRNKNANTAKTYIDASVLDPSEERQRLAQDPESGYQGIDVNALPEPPPEASFVPADLQQAEPGATQGNGQEA